MVTALSEVEQVTSQVTVNVLESLAPALSSFGQFVAKLSEQTFENEESSDEEDL